jgi:hypothetical protein
VIEGADLELFERSVARAVSDADRAAVDPALDALGWPDALEDDPRAAVSVLFEQQGAAGAASSALDLVLRRALGVGGEPAGVVLPPLGAVAPPGSLRGDRVKVAGVGTGGLVTHDRALVVARTDEGEVAVIVATGALEVRRVAGIDPGLGLVEVRGGDVAVGAGAQPVPGWSMGVAAAQVAIGHELVGASRTMLSLAREHALERIQFGQPIAKFQAVRHRLAEKLVAIETADAMLEAAWLDGSPGMAAMAKALAGRGARTAARHCQQVLAGIGFTTEHDLHRYIRRVFVLDELFGSARTLTRSLGEELLATRQLPPLLPL